MAGMAIVKKALSQARLFQSFIGLILVFVLAVAFSPYRHGANTFIGVENLTDMIRMMSIKGIIALAMTYVILTSGIDLSVGSIMALSTCILAELLRKWDPGLNTTTHVTIAITASMFGCMLVGMINGYVIAKLKVAPFIVTLATMIGIRGFALWLTDNNTIDFGFGKGLAAKFGEIVSEKQVMIAVYVALAVVLVVILSKTIFGRYVRAVGDNEKAARYSGLPVDRVKVYVYGLSGLLCGIAGILYAAQANQGDPNSGSGYELDAIAAVVIGGTSLSGGKGSVVGTIIGTMIIGVITNILGLKNIGSNAQLMIKAIIIILAVWMQKRDKAE